MCYPGAIMNHYWRAVLLLLAFAAGPAAWAQLEFEKTASVTDTTPHQAKVKVEFAFQNKGTKPVTIVSIQTSCGCTTAKLDKKTYAPGEGGTIEAELKVSTSPGTVEKKVMVKTDDKAHELYTLTIGANVPQYAAIEPSFLKWEFGAEPTPKSVHVKVGEKFVIRVTKVSSSNPAWTVEVKTVKDGAEYDIVVTPPKNMNEASRTALGIETDFPKDNPLVFGASARVAQPREKPKTNWLLELFR